MGPGIIRRSLFAAVMASASFASLAYAQVGGSGGANPTGKEGERPPAKPSKPAGPEGEDRPSASGGTVDLRPKFKQGQVLKYVMEQSSRNATTSTQSPEINQDQKMIQKLGLSMRVIETLPGGGAMVEVVYDAVKVRLETDDFVAEYDSAAPAGSGSGGKRATKPAPSRAPASTPSAAKPTRAAPVDKEMSDMLAGLIGQMVGTKLTLEVDGTGAIKRVSGGEALAGGGLDMSKLIGGGGAGGAGMGGIGIGGGAGGGGGGMQWLVGGGLSTGGMARVGQTWTNEDSLGNTPLGAFKMSTTHKLLSHSGSLARLSFTGRALAASEGNGNGAGGAGGGNAMQLKGTKYDGTYSWDTREGCLREMASLMKVEIEGSAAGTGMKMFSESSFTVKRSE